MQSQEELDRKGEEIALRENKEGESGYITLNIPRPSVKKPNLDKLKSSSARFAVVMILVATGMGFVGGWAGARISEDSNGLTGSLSSQKKIVTSESQVINQVAKNVGKSVVSVNVISQETSTDVFGFPQSSQQQSAGTGIIISSDGLIITNRHVVPAGTSAVSVTLSDGTELKDVKIVGRTNSSDTLDVAFLKIKNSEGKKLIPADLGDSSKVQVGDPVVAIGNALGQFQNTVTSGIISGYGRSVQAGDGSGASSESLSDLFQTDAAINQGNSGGPLVNLNGQVIGINTAVAGNAQNIGFAIPINDFKGLVKQVISKGKLERPYLGVRYIPLTADYAYEFNLKTNRGAYIAPSSSAQSVLAGSPADKAGLKEKDVITKIDGVNIDETHSLNSLLSQHVPGDKVKLTVLRGSQTLHVTVKLGQVPNSDS